MPSFIDLAGTRSGSLVAVRRAENRKRETMWECICDCGSSHVVRASTIRSGTATSCGCVERKRYTTHKMSAAPEYAVWVAMVSRCTNKKNPRFKDYGGRGITLCERWKAFENFISDVGLRPSDLHSIDRINNDFGYEPGNCRWSNQSQQMRNTRVTARHDVGVDMLSSGRFRASINICNKRKHIGVFATRDMAIAARKEAESLFWGEVR